MNVNRTYEKYQAVSVKKNISNTIEIQGQLYDALTGAPVKSAAETATNLKRKISDIKHPINNGRHGPEPSKILMRSAVKKPDNGFNDSDKTLESSYQSTSSDPVKERPSFTHIATQQQQRIERAALHKQSQQISHFPEPRQTSYPQPVKQVIANQASLPAVTQVSQKNSTDILLERNLDQVSSASKESMAKSKRLGWRKFSFIAIPVLVVLAIIIFGGKTFTSLQLKIASAKAGFNTSLPSYHPAGFRLDQMSYNNGIFASNFYTKNNNQSYTITQKATSWDNQDLVNNYISLVTTNYKAIKLGNRTIYLYGNGNATWVNNHIWYQIDTDGYLNEAQIIDLANSL